MSEDGVKFPEDALRIRLITDDDPIHDLTLLLNRAYKVLADMGLKYVATWQGDEITLRRVSSGECYLGFMEDRLVSTILFRPPGKGKFIDFYERDGVSHISQFGVEPDLHGCGIGNLMMDFIEMRATESGAAELALDTAESATHLIEWYKRRGYRFIDYIDWEVTNYRSVILSRRIES